MFFRSHRLPRDCFPLGLAHAILMLFFLCSMGYALQVDVIEARPEGPKPERDIIRDYGIRREKDIERARKQFEHGPVPPVLREHYPGLFEVPKPKGKIDLLDENRPRFSKAALGVYSSRWVVDPYLESPPRLSGQDLASFYELNRRVLDDMGLTPLGQLLYTKPEEAFKMPPGALRSLMDADAESRPAGLPAIGTQDLPSNPESSKAVSIARLADGTEIFTVFEVGNRSRRAKSFIIGSKYRADAKGLENALAGTRRVYRYGPTPRQFDLSSFVRTQRTEEIRRTTYTSKFLPDLELSLDEIDKRTLKAESAVLLNGLPSTKESAAKLGIMSGDPDAWVEFHRDVNTLLAGNTRNALLTKAEFDAHLVNGNSDVIVMVAHADGIRIFLNDKIVTLDDISKLPNRKDIRKSPRIAVIVSCDAGAAMKSSSLFFKKDIPNFAEVLLSKGFVDVVIAPDHKIRKDEVLDVIRQLPKGLKTNNLPSGWNKISVNILRERDNDNALSS